MENEEIAATTKKIIAQQKNIDALKNALNSQLIGQAAIIQQVVVALLCNGHILLEGVPGLGKTLLVKAIAAALNADYKRVQFTPDLLPADITGTLIYNPSNGSFNTKKGPIFTNILLADEINRAPAKVQSALLEAMEEKQVTLGDETYPLPDPFLVLATQNPLEQQGTYPLPEAQLDRFFIKLHMGYPTPETEIDFIQLFTSNLPNNKAAKKEISTFNVATLKTCQQLVKEVYLDVKMAQYIMQLVAATRTNSDAVFLHGISPRGSINTALAAKAIAFLHERAYVTPDDVKEAFIPINRHRVMLSYDAFAQGLQADNALQNILNQTSI